ncbi:MULTISPECIES: heme-binding domain-containing protein [Pedobacter]|uniref:Haem-binding domain-containing protein n=5 Tax=Pedobacter TaxID=84567 RepID=A0A1I0TWE3_9SPHI|nr:MULTISPECIES: heme-binding domain-containing protein [Pedobacter]RZM28735.1 MAG: cytochrome C [Pedobacter sp.]KQR68309.1 cytochrome C [Pedobacter sp. Leaf176]MCX2575673.1 heme-binding domain-containing protein [Pedobacter sandarakinus]MCZ4224749.1 heme-binding domain-containing protein [Pedobacter sp. SJ11]PWS29714.1 cytochrome C [Pedobacter paludis]
MTGIKKTFLGLLVIFMLMQILQPARNKSAQAMPQDISTLVPMPDDVQGILKKSCYDCHSNNTEYPWYAYVQPLHWYLNSHIRSGKEELNFNEFAGYTLRRRQNKLRAIENSLKDGTMPLSSYSLIHRNAILDPREKSILIKWVQNSRDSLNRKNLTAL